MIPLKQSPMIHESKTKPGWSWGIECLVFVAVFFVAQTIMSIPVAAAMIIWIVSEALTGEIPDVFSILSDMPDQLMLVNLFSTVIMTATVILFCLWLQKRKPASLGLRKKNAVREYLIGTILGILLFALCIGLCLPFGAVKLKPQSFSIGTWVLYLLGFLVQGMSEEVLCRGYLMPSVARKYPLWAAVIINSVLFSLLHIFNNGVTFIALLNITLFGIFISIYVLRRGDLWGACAMHSFWNFVQGNVFGVSVSGTGSGVSPLAATLPEQYELWNGGSFGLEGGLAVTVVLTIGILVLLFLIPNAKGMNEKYTMEQPTQPL